MSAAVIVSAVVALAALAAAAATATAAQLRQRVPHASADDVEVKAPGPIGHPSMKAQIYSVSASPCYAQWLLHASMDG